MAANAGFRSIVFVSQTVMMFYGTLIFTTAIATALSYFELADAGEMGKIGGKTVLLNQAYAEIIGYSQLALSIPAAIAFLYWLARAAGNLPALRSEAEWLSPAAAVAAFLVPVVNFVAPFFVMRQIFRGSADFDSSVEGPDVVRDDSAISLWWFLMISNIAFSFLIGPMLLSSPGELSAKAAKAIMLIPNFLSILTGFLGIWIINRISRQQDLRHEEILRLEKKEAAAAL